MISTCSSNSSRLASWSMHRRAEGFHLPRVVAAADAEHGAALGQDIGDRVILGQAQRVPHRRDVEAAADFQGFGQVREVNREHQQVRDHLVAFVLEVVFGQPQRVPAETVHQRRDALGLAEHAGQLALEKRRSLAGVAFWP